MAVVINKAHADNILAWETKATAMPAPPASLHVALLTAMPTTNTGTGMVEVAGGAYARLNVTTAQWNAAATDVDNLTEKAASNAVLTWAQATAAWGTIVGVALYNPADTTWYRAINLVANKVVNSGDTFSIAAGDLDVKVTGV